MRIITAISIAFLLTLAVLPVHAQSAEPPIPPSPAPGDYVLDGLDWLTNEQEATINSIIGRLDQDGLAKIYVVTMDDCGPDKLSFRKSLYDTWGIGHPNDNDGLLILACWYNGDISRRSIEQLYGPGLDAFLTSSTTDQIAQKNFRPAFQKNNPGEGLLQMVISYNAILRNPPTHQTQSNSQDDFFNSLTWQRIKIFLGILLILYIALEELNPKRRRSRYERSSYGEGYSDHGGSDGGGSDGGGGSSTRF